MSNEPQNNWNAQNPNPSARPAWAENNYVQQGNPAANSYSAPQNPYAVPVTPAGVPFVQPAYTVQGGYPMVSGHSRTLILLLAFFLGSLGIHRFAVGKIGTGFLMLITFGGFGIWTIIDLVMIIVGNFTDSQGARILNW